MTLMFEYSRATLDCMCFGLVFMGFAHPALRLMCVSFQQDTYTRTLRTSVTRTRPLGMCLHFTMMYTPNASDGVGADCSVADTAYDLCGQTTTLKLSNERRKSFN